MIELIKLILAAISKFFGWQQENRTLNAGNAEQQVKNDEATIHDITTAHAAREKARDDTSAATRTDELPDDGFRRD